MYANIEIISNNTYNFSNFTYKIPKQLEGKVHQGTITKIKFRNRNLLGVVISIKDKTNIENLNSIEKIVHNLDSTQFKYLKFVSLVNRINIGILIYNLLELTSFTLQKKTTNRSITNLSFDQINKIKFKEKNVFFVPSLKHSKLLYEKLKEVLEIDYYQKFGGKSELQKILNSKEFTNIILLSNNFEKITIKDGYNYIFYDANSNAFKLPKLNELNIIESAYLKNYLFGGHFIFISEFPNFEYFNQKWHPQDKYEYKIEYFISNNLQDNIELINHKYPNKIFNYYSNEKLPNVNNFNYIDNLDDSKLDTLIIQNPNISKNRILNSFKLIYLLKILNHAMALNLQIIVFSSNELDINKTLNSVNMIDWINNEINVREKYGPNNLFKIYSIYSDNLFETKNTKYLLGPKIVNDKYIYELQIKLDDKLDYELLQNIYKLIKDCEIKRIRHIS
jgi:hypothetical protein